MSECQRGLCDDSRSLFDKQNAQGALAITIAAMAVAFLFYGKFLSNFFIYDDFRYLENIFADTKTLLFGYNTTRFLSNLAFVPLFALSKYDPFGYNLFNLLLHATNAIIFAAVVTRLTGRVSLAAVAALLFASSAALADAVLWKCANNTLMSTCFSLLAFLHYLKWRDGGRLGMWLASLFFFVAAMYSKEDAAALPLLIFCYEIICRKQTWRAILRPLPYGMIVIIYLVTAQVLIQVFNIKLEHYERFLSFRPLYAFFAGYSAFLMNPAGYFSSPAVAVGIGAIVVAAALVFVEDKRLLAFALLGIFITFLPSSLTSLGSFTPTYIFESVSRYLYFPSTMAALAMTCVLAEIRVRLSQKVAVTLVVAFCLCFMGYNYLQVGKRGQEWQRKAKGAIPFLQEMQRVMPQFPPNSYIYVIRAPIGRAYVQQSLRAFYGKTDITWMVDPKNFIPPPGSSAFLIFCNWDYNRKQLQISVLPVNSASFPK